MVKDCETIMRNVDEANDANNAQGFKDRSIPKRVEPVIERMSQTRVPGTVGNPSGYGMKLTDNEIAEAVKSFKAE